MLLLLLDPESIIPGIVLTRSRCLDGTPEELLVYLLSRDGVEDRVMILKAGYDLFKISHQKRSTQGYRPDRLRGLIRFATTQSTFRLSSNLLSFNHALYLRGNVHDLFLKPVFLHLVLHMLTSEYHAKVPLSSWLFHTFRSLRRIHFLDDLDGMLCDFIINVLFLRGQLAHKLVGILVGTLSPELPVEVAKIGLKLLLALHHRLLVKLLDIREGANPGV